MGTSGITPLGSPQCFPLSDAIITHGNDFVNTFLKFFCNLFVTNYD